MDTQTQIGIGAAAMLTLAGIAAPIVSWWISAPIMALCVVAAAWGFWPLLPIPSPTSRRLLIEDAARIAYEAAEQAGVTDIFTSAEQTPKHV